MKDELSVCNVSVGYSKSSYFTCTFNKTYYYLYVFVTQTSTFFKIRNMHIEKNNKI